MPFEIVRNDITKMSADAIVNAANSSLLGGGGVDGAIHRAAGPGLLAECRTLGGCETGQAKITGGYGLPCRYVIHTVGPVWQGGNAGEEALLASCYRESLLLAEKYGCESVAFPLISSGAYGYPKDRALKVATDTVRDFLMEHEMTVYLVIFGREAFMISRRLYAHVRAYIDDSYIGPDYEREERARRILNRPWQEQAALSDETQADAGGAPDLFDGICPGGALPDSMFSLPDSAPEPDAALPKQGRLKKEHATLKPHAAPEARIPQAAEAYAAAETGSLEEYLQQIDEGFREMLLRKIDEQKITDAECYKRANIDRKLFNKIKNQPGYKPGKTTVLALAVSLRLNLNETREMLMKAGYSLSRSSKGDLIVEYFIKQKHYDIYEINETLFSFDQKLLGSAV